MASLLLSWRRKSASCRLPGTCSSLVTHLSIFCCIGMKILWVTPVWKTTSLLSECPVCSSLHTWRLYHSKSSNSTTWSSVLLHVYSVHHTGPDSVSSTSFASSIHQRSWNSSLSSASSTPCISYCNVYLIRHRPLACPVITETTVVCCAVVGEPMLVLVVIIAILNSR